MNTPKYERPKFEFQELQLLERVADTCWGYKEAWYDFNGNGTKDPSEIIPIGSYGSCKDVEESLINYFANMGISGNGDHHFCSTNTRSTTVHPIVS